ncbi:MAG TPA: type II toxin-antitoxin system RelE/ParE family toxin [Gammaproteobacteria bacterium]|nr:type II toxin-antitoxin system RelE/ParE family toxin [Gammaproteobacteria bacterium]
MKVHWTDEALAELRAIRAYLNHYSAEAAYTTVSRIIISAGRLAELPHSGHVLREFNQSDLRELLIRPYRIIYRILADRIDIITVWHYRRLLPHHLT